MALTRPKSAQINFDAHNVTDPLIRINSGQSGANDKDAGWVIERGSDTNVCLMWDESADEFVLVNTTEDGTTSGNVTISSYADLQVGTINTATLEIGGTAVTATAAELNYTDGVTSNIQTQLDAKTSYANSDVDAHLNQANPTSGYVLSWNGTDYAWVSNAGYTDSNVDSHLNQANPTDGYVLSWTSGDYAWVAQSGGGSSTLAALTDTTVSSPVNGQLLQYNGSAWVNVNSQDSTGITQDEFDGDGSTVSFTLTSTSTTDASFVALNGIVQEGGAGKSYTVSGTTLTFTTAPASGERVVVRNLFSVKSTDYGLVTGSHTGNTVDNGSIV